MFYEPVAAKKGHYYPTFMTVLSQKKGKGFTARWIRLAWNNRWRQMKCTWLKTNNNPKQKKKSSKLNSLIGNKWKSLAIRKVRNKMWSKIVVSLLVSQSWHFLGHLFHLIEKLLEPLVRTGEEDGGYHVVRPHD